MARVVNCLPCKHEDLGPYSIYMKEPVIVAFASMPNTGKAEPDRKISPTHWPL